MSTPKLTSAHLVRYIYDREKEQRAKRGDPDYVLRLSTFALASALGVSPERIRTWGATAYHYGSLRRAKRGATYLWSLTVKARNWIDQGPLDEPLDRVAQ